MVADKVVGLRRVDGTLEENPTKIEGMFSVHFQNIFSAYSLSKLVLTARDAYCGVTHKVSLSNRDKLDGNFIKEELFVALSSMLIGESSSINGLPCEFYKVIWDTVRDDFCSLVWEGSSRKFSEFLNQHLIKFIPKNTTRDIIWGWHPIALLILVCKIMAEYLDLRVKEVAKTIVHCEQTSFV